MYLNRSKPEQVTAVADHWTKFAEKMYMAWDADPGYYALQLTPIPRNQQYRAAVAWCAYYNLGIAAEASEYTGTKFWDYLESIYSTAKRTTERRHFRGDAGRRALAQWRSRWPKPEAMAEYAACGDYQTSVSYFDIRRRGQDIAQYGDYFYWKWCDLREVLGFGPVDMAGSERYSPKLPQQGAVLIVERDYNTGKRWATAAVERHYDPIIGKWHHDVLENAYWGIIQYGRAHMIPPRTTTYRPFSIQEAETVCCVYKQMINGSYTYGTRTAKAVNRLEAAAGKTAKAMRETLLNLSPYSREELAAALASLKE